MEMLVTQGGRPLRGQVTVSGAKNAALPIMAAALMADGVTCLKGVPDLVDVRTLSLVLQSLGVRVERQPDQSLELQVLDDKPCLADYELVRRMRASVCVLGALLGRRGRAFVSLPGGCAIGHRPVDLHLKGLHALGAEIRIERGYVMAQAKQLRGADIYLGGPFGSTVTGTCNVLSAAVLARGTTTISAAACEPEVVDLGNCLNAMGARISGLGTPFLKIEGVPNLTGVTHKIIPDRIEAATLMVAAAMTLGDVLVREARADHLAAVLDVLKAAGVDIEASAVGLRVSCHQRPHPIDAAALPYPGVPTDAQAQLTALLSLAHGISVVTDKVFPDRFLHIPELNRLGANVRREGASAIISGVQQLSGASVMASDLRASAALILAGLAAEGPSVIRRLYHLDRGYERLDAKLAQLGAIVDRRQDLPEQMPAGLQLDPEEIMAPPSADAGDALPESSPAPISAHQVPSPKFLKSPVMAPSLGSAPELSVDP